MSEEGELIKARMDFAGHLAELPSYEDAQKLVAAEPDNADAIYAIAMRCFQKEETSQALDYLLELLKKHPSYQDGIAKKTLLQLFTMLGDQTDIVNEYRRKMARLLY
jgi:putative thioredoxin